MTIRVRIPASETRFPKKMRAEVEGVFGTQRSLYCKKVTFI